ncbi:DUF2975 domain-containing protein [Oerskovia flava]|uniref:DUF2975 domain-containing protein n=1 Tax=Oerskovia flava TaxID=2986422 RepID=UPI002240A74E|nr:DUF2975 domain-containing protein [Oerskovia sp. JB1-3-2]
MNRTLVAPLRALLVLVALGAVVTQVLAPLLATEVATTYPEVRPIVLPYSVLAVLAVLLVEVALVAVWHLLTLVSRDTVFDRRAVRWVDVIVACAAGVTALSAGVFGHLVFGAQIGGPLVFFGFVGSLVGGAALTLLLAVMRGLLVSAAVNRRELEEVI